MSGYGERFTNRLDEAISKTREEVVADQLREAAVEKQKRAERAQSVAQGALEAAEIRKRKLADERHEQVIVAKSIRSSAKDTAELLVASGFRPEQIVSGTETKRNRWYPETIFEYRFPF